MPRNSRQARRSRTNPDRPTQTTPANIEAQLLEAVRGDAYWEAVLERRPEPAVWSLHLAIFAEPFLQYVFDGLKTVESRFSMRRVAPYACVGPGDVVLVKQVSGPVLGVFRVADAWFYRLDPASWSLIRREYTAALCAQDPIFWERRSSASFASLMRIDHPRRIEPIQVAKRDRRGWVVLRPAQLGQLAMAL